MRHGAQMIPLLVLLGCTGAPCLPTVGVAATVCTVNAEGPVSADEVVWFFDPLGDGYDGEHALECANEECSVWYLTEVNDGAVVVQGRKVGNQPADPGCEWRAEDSVVIDLKPEYHHVADLDLELTLECE